MRKRTPLSRGALWSKKGNSRPNRLARGMQDTSDRSGHGFRLSSAALSLAVYGSTDNLARGINWNTAGSGRACPCCGQKVAAVVLSERGKQRLAFLRRKRAGEPEA
jgi:hypothetical protein